MFDVWGFFFQGLFNSQQPTSNGELRPLASQKWVESPCWNRMAKKSHIPDAREIRIYQRNINLSFFHGPILNPNNTPIITNWRRRPRRFLCQSWEPDEIFQGHGFGGSQKDGKVCPVMSYWWDLVFYTSFLGGLQYSIFFGCCFFTLQENQPMILPFPNVYPGNRKQQKNQGRTQRVYIYTIYWPNHVFTDIFSNYSAICPVHSSSIGLFRILNILLGIKSRTS